MPKYAVIDLGSNSVRLVVYEVEKPALDRCRRGARPVPKRDFRAVLDEKKMAGLSAYVSEGHFSQAGVEKAASVLTKHLTRAEYCGCDRVDVFATAVLRNAENSTQAVADIQDRIGVAVRVLSAEDEAHLGFVGASCDSVFRDAQAQGGLQATNGVGSATGAQNADGFRNATNVATQPTHATLIDIGGGSTELTRICHGQDLDKISIPQGSVSSYAQFVETILATPQEAARIAQAFRDNLGSVPNLEAFRSPILYGIGGSVRACAKMIAAMDASPSAPKPRVLTRQDLCSILDFAQNEPGRFAHTLIRAVPDRAHTLIPGTVILEALMDQLESERIQICAYGLREGYLIERMMNM